MPDRLLDRRRFVVGLSAATLGGVAGCVSSGDSNEPSGDNSNEPTETPGLSFSDTDDSEYPSYSGTLSISGDDDFWSFKIQMESSFGLRYAVRNEKSEEYDFDVLVLSPEQYGNYLQEIRDTGPVIEDIDALASKGVRSEAQRSGELEAGTYFVVVDNTDISDAGDFGGESTREVTIELETYDPALVAETPASEETGDSGAGDAEQSRVEQLKEEYPNWAFIDGQTELVVLKPIEANADDYSVTISGTIVNASDSDYDYVQISFGLYDGPNATGAKVGTALDNLSGLDSGQRWRFEAIGSDSDAASFDIEGTTAY